MMMMQNEVEEDRPIATYGLHFFIDTVIQSFDIEIARIAYNEKLTLRLIEKLHDYYGNRDSQTFFILANLKNITLDIFQDAEFRDFILSLADRVSLLISVAEFNDEQFFNSIVIAICRNKVNPANANQSLINKELNESLYIRPDVLKSLLADNFWIMVVYILTVFFQRSQVYLSLKENV